MNRQGIGGTYGKRSMLLKACGFLFILAVLSAPLWGRPALASTYDNFSSGKIQTSKWTIDDSDGLFSVVPGSSVGVSQQAYVLHVSGSGSASYPKSRLATTKTFSGKFAAGINFVNFTSDITPSAADTSSPSINLIIFGGASDPLILVSRTHSSSGQAIGWRQYDKPNGTELSTGGVPYAGASGSLLVVYAGNQLSLGYSTSTDPAQWLSTFTVVATFSVTFSVRPSLEILASEGSAGKAMSVDIGGLYYSSKLPALLKGPSSTYDTFSSGAIETNEWTIDDPNGFFTVVPGSSVGVPQADVLQFTGAGSGSFPRSYLTATRPFGGNLFAGMDFYNFTSDFTPTPTDTANPAIQLRIVGGASDPVYLVARTHSPGGQVIGWRTLDSSGNTLAKGSSFYSAPSGAVLVAYMGSQLSLGYSPSTNPAHWANSFRAVATFPITYTAAPTLEIGGSGGGGGSVSANVGGLYFSADIPALTVDITGTGAGNVSSLPSGINCGDTLLPTCSADYKKGSKVTLTPTPDSGSVFTGWSGDCKGNGACSVTMKADKTVWATFNSGFCTYTISSSGKTLSYKGGTITIGVKATVYNYCLAPDIVNNDPGWISYTAGSFTKNKGSIKITVPEYDNPAGRTGTMTIGGKTFTVTQKGQP